MYGSRLFQDSACSEVLEVVADAHPQLTTNKHDQICLRYEFIAALYLPYHSIRLVPIQVLEVPHKEPVPPPILVVAITCQNQNYNLQLHL